MMIAHFFIIAFIMQTTWTSERVLLPHEACNEYCNVGLFIQPGYPTLSTAFPTLEQQSNFAPVYLVCQPFNSPLKTVNIEYIPWRIDNRQTYITLERNGQLNRYPIGWFNLKFSVLLWYIQYHRFCDPTISVFVVSRKTHTELYQQSLRNSDSIKALLHYNYGIRVAPKGSNLEALFCARPPTRLTEELLSHELLFKIIPPDLLKKVYGKDMAQLLKKVPDPVETREILFIKDEEPHKQKKATDQYFIREKTNWLNLYYDNENYKSLSQFPTAYPDINRQAVIKSLLDGLELFYILRSIQVGQEPNSKTTIRAHKSVYTPVENFLTKDLLYFMELFNMHTQQNKD